jgi:hypothetical protein
MARLPVFGNILFEMVDCGPGQGRSFFEPTSVAARYVEDFKNV